MFKTVLLCGFALAVFLPSNGGAAQPKQIPIEAPAMLELKNVKAQSVTYKGLHAIRIDAAGPDTLTDGSRYAVITGTTFTDGIIDLDVVGDTAPNADPAFRGFVGVAFRVASGASKYECFYVRPKNARSEDQLQRNHSVQYISAPDFPWQLLREKTPGKYESYVDMVTGDWTKLRVEVRGEKAKLYVNGSAQPVLLVNDLKLGQSSGAIALWIGPGTIAHFANLRVTQ